MNKLKFSFKIKELELEIEGTREEVSTITDNISQQLKGMIRPAGAIGEITDRPKTPLAVTEDGEITEIRTTARKRRAPVSNGSKTEKPKAFDFKNDPAKYGSPLQTWTTLQKSIWLLYVANSEINTTEMSAGEIAETFNKHFKQQGTVRATNVSRDFGKQKGGAIPIVGENSTISPAKWYLTEEGTKAAQKLIQNLKTGSA
jgi:hypothetical protein